MNETEIAIQWLKENLPPLEDYGEMIGAPPQYCGVKYVYNDPCGYIFETAIEALQEKAEREKGCATCNKSNLFIKQHKFPYCPMCGRKLGENK